MNKYSSFIFESYNFDKDNKILLLKYSYDNELFFEETIEFPGDKILNDSELDALDRAFRYLHLACGISYYKLFIPKNIKIKTFVLSKEEADFFNNFYFNGLGEFSYKNNITDLKDRINFPFTINTQNNSLNFPLEKRYVVPVGGGKDSITTLEIIKKHFNDILLCSVGTAKAIEDTIQVSGLKSFRINRKISQKLLDLNTQVDSSKGCYNGHIPISGILAFIFCAASVIYDYDTILMSNERSANVGNLEFNGTIVNHQWSKSFEFEKSVNAFFKKHIISDFNYMSFLRPISEIHIAKIFSKLDKYHKLFVSCNKNYKINDRLNHWCCECDKCRFVFLILSVFLNKEKMIGIFGKNLFENEEDADKFMELCGLKNYKPFECVGEVEESIYSFMNVSKDFENDIVVVRTREEILKRGIDVGQLEKSLFLPSREHLLSNELYEILLSEL